MSGLLRFSIGFYVLATALGLVLRTFFAFPFQGLVIAHALHAHSHTLYFGWAALGILTLGFDRIGANGRAAKTVLWAIVGLSAATFVSFLEGGYSTPSIVISSVSLLLWAVATAIFWRQARGKQGIDVAFLRAGMIYLLVASLGAITRVVLIVFDAPALHKSLAVFAFLYSFAWFFVFSVIGLLLGRASALGVRFDERFFRWQLRLSVPLAWLTFPLGVAGGVTGTLGTSARIAAVGLLVPTLLGALGFWKAAGGGAKLEVRPSVREGLRWLALWLALEGILSALGGLGLAASAVHSRHLAVLYLHVLLVGVVSLGLMFAMLARLETWSTSTVRLHCWGLTVMSLGLAAAGASALGIHLPAPLVRGGMILAVLGGALIFAAGVCCAFSIYRASRTSPTFEAVQEPG